MRAKLPPRMTPEPATRTLAATGTNQHTGRLTVAEGTGAIVGLAIIDADGRHGITLQPGGS